MTTLAQPDYTTAAVAALAQAHRAEPDFAGFLARVLAALARRLGSSGAVLAGRPGSWEAADVRHLLAGTVGASDEYLFPEHLGPVAGWDDTPAHHDGR
jgi:hypothetical protein